MLKNKTLVIGASKKVERYSNIAVQLLLEYNYQVRALGFKAGKINSIQIETEKFPYKDIDTVTLYLNAKRQEEYYKYIISLNPRRVIFNPGTENIDFIKLLKDKNIDSEIACTLILLRTNQY